MKSIHFGVILYCINREEPRKKIPDRIRPLLIPRRRAEKNSSGWAILMDEYGADPRLMKAGIAPSIGPEAFEVGEEVGVITSTLYKNQ